MKILLIGYGKMGKTIEQLALRRGHTIAGKISRSNTAELHAFNCGNADVAIEFTRPEAAFGNISYCLEQGIPVVSGSTGWLKQFQEAETLCREKNGAFFYASNYSIGVNLFFHFNEYIARVMKDYPQFDVSMREIHHVHKLDHPSGTAITTAEGILRNYPEKQKWVDGPAQKPAELGIVSEREGEVVGTHIVKYESGIDKIELGHVAHSRDGFAEGAVMAAEWLQGKKGIFGMKDMLNL